jgi:hypothetical protein
MNGRWIGIIETNYAWASKYWATRKGCSLRLDKFCSYAKLSKERKI